MGSHKYRVTVEAVVPENRLISGTPSLLSFETIIHEDLFHVVESVRATGFVDQDDAIVLAVGLKLFTEAVIQHRHFPAFAVFEAPLRNFSQKFQTLRSIPDL